MREYEIHISDVARFKQCRRAWSYASPLRRNLEPKEKYAPFFVGSLVHHALEMHYRKQQAPSFSVAEYAHEHCTLAEMSEPNIQNQLTLACGLVDHYLLWQRYDKTWLADSAFTFVAPEQPFRTLLYRTGEKKVWLAGTFDGVVKHDATGKLYLWEIKTTRSLVEREKQLALDEQTNAYAWAASRVLDQEISGVIYTLIRKKIPDEPKENKNGLLEQKASADTTAEWYLQQVKNYHKDIAKEAISKYIRDNYSDYLQTLLQQPNKFFKRVIVQRSQTELDIAIEELKDVAGDMTNPRIKPYATGGYHCNYCLFRQPCLAYNAGTQYLQILADNYQQNKRFAETDGE